MKMNRRKNSGTLKSFFINLAVAFCALVVLFCALELTLRVGGWAYSFFARSHTQCLSANNTGCFVTQTILCVGDSFTEGVGASFRESYPKQLEGILLKSGFRDVRVVNQGRGGISSSIALKKMPAYIDAYKPKIVLLLIGCNDFWNLEDSNYFFLYKNKLPFGVTLQQALNKSKVYKLFKIALLNIKDKWDKLQKSREDSIPTHGIMTKVNARSAELFFQAEQELRYGRDVPAIERFKQALEADPKNYLAAYWAGERYCVLREKERAREYLWKAIRGCDDWSADFSSKVSNVAWRLDDQPAATFTHVRKYLLSTGNADKVRPALRCIDAQLAIISREKILDEVLSYNLREISKLAKEKEVILILLNYPSPKKVSVVIREAAIKNNVLLVDNDKVFAEKLRTAKTQDYFVPDSHCNGRGYQVMADAAVQVILKERLLVDKHADLASALNGD